MPEDEETQQREFDVKQSKSFRKQLDGVLQEIKGNYCDMPFPDFKHRNSRERSLAVTKLQEAIMWLGMDLKDLNEPNPYPQSYNPENTQIEKTADDLKL